MNVHCTRLGVIALCPHTKTEGAVVAITTSISPVPVCPKCGTSAKSGQLSCCTRGGAWFKKCGDEGDSNFDHTWLEGLQACEDVARSFSGEARAKLILRRETAIAKKSGTARQQNSSLLPVIDPNTVIVSDTVTANSKACEELKGILLFTSFSLIMMQM